MTKDPDLEPQSSQPRARIAFLGSGPFALPALEALAGDYDVAGVVTQPDRPVGRGRRLQRGLIADTADRLGIAVVQPESLRADEAAKAMQRLEPDALIVASYGQILSRAILNVPRRGALNLHPSLLPRHRGASPIAAAILAGDTTTGVTVMEMVRRMDAGPIVAQRESEIRDDDTAGVLTERLAGESASLLLEVLPAWLAESIEVTEQDESRATYSKVLTKADGIIDWSQTGEEIERAVRAYQPWPVAHTIWDGRVLRVFRARVADDAGGSGGAPEPGTVMTTAPDGIVVKTGSGSLVLCDVQLEGGKRMAAGDLVRGRPEIGRALFRGSSA